jgi:hypothetical protein
LDIHETTLQAEKGARKGLGGGQLRGDNLEVDRMKERLGQAGARGREQWEGNLERQHCRAFILRR